MLEAVMASDVMGDFQEPYGAVVVMWWMSSSVDARYLWLIHSTGHGTPGRQDRGNLTRDVPRGVVVVRDDFRAAALRIDRNGSSKSHTPRLLQSWAAALIAACAAGVTDMPSNRSPVTSRVLNAQDLASFTLQQFGTEFTAGPWKLTLSQLVRGADAASQIAAASDQNAAPPDGFDYLLFQVNATNAGQERTWLDYDDFAVMGSSGLVHRSLELMPPDPMLQAAVEPGESTSGWVVGEIESGDQSPVILFDPRILTGLWADQVIATAAGGSFPSTGVSPQQINDTGASPSAPATANQPIVTADWVLELQQAVFGQDVYDRTDFRTQAVGDSDPTFIPQWAAFEVTATNNRDGSAVSHFPATAFSLAYADGSEVLDVSRLTPPLPDISGDYLPGASFTGWAAFERPADFTGTLVRFQPFRTDEDVRYLTWGDGSAPANAEDVEVAEEGTPAAPSGTFANGTTVTTNESDVNMRSGATTSADIVATLALDTSLTVTGDPVEADGYTWYPVQDPATGNSGFVAANFLRAAA
jgi:hypothetical protein